MEQEVAATMQRRLQTVSTVEALEDDLASRVLAGEFLPGFHLLENELAEEYQVGRHTLRAAFDGLTRRALLERKRNRGVFVRTLTTRDLEEIYEVRAALEVAAFRSLAEHRTIPTGALEAIGRLDGLGKAAKGRSRKPMEPLSPRSRTASAVIEADLAFHCAIVDGAGNKRLSMAHADLRSEMRLGLLQLVDRYAPIQEIAETHAELVRVISTGDVASAEAAIRVHLTLVPARARARAESVSKRDSGSNLESRTSLSL